MLCRADRFAFRLLQRRDGEHSFASASGYVAVLVLALYMKSTDVTVLYSHPHRLWILCCLLLYWINRVWMVAFRGEMHDDPIAYAIKNCSSLLTNALCVVAVLIAISPRCMVRDRRTRSSCRMSECVDKFHSR
ncbi:hypothetical protein OKW46_007050 [Paraburkholderia sp. WSM4179]|nr:hypothetical protein [Paraburkholderia sp. WSM4179]